MRAICFSTLAVSLILCSCYSYVVFPEKYRELSDSFPKTSAYVINPELEEELNVLKTSGIYSLVSDSSCLTRIRLRKLDRSACGNSVSPLLELTLGLIPLYAPDRYYYSFDEISRTDTTQLTFELKVARRVSFYEIFRSQKDLNSKLAQALKGEYLDRTNSK